MDASNDEFGSLPAELRCRVFEFLPSSSLKNVRLVSRTWACEAAAVLFQTTEVDLVDLRGRSLDAITDGPPGGFLDSIKNLSIARPIRKLTYQDTRDFRIAFLSLLGALPRDNLVSFASASALDREAIGVLLRTQSRLRELTITPNSGARNGLPGLNYVRDSLSELRSLNLGLIGTNFNSYDRLGTWFGHSSSLKKLQLIGSQASPDLHIFKGWTLLSGTPLLKLRHLHLRNVAFSTLIESLPVQLDLPFLKGLYIQACSKTSILLEAFTAAYTTCKDNNLKKFEHRSVLGNDDMAAIKFLESLKRAEAIILRSNVANEFLPAPDTFAETGHSLHFLHISISSTGNHYSASELNGLCKSCPKLQVLCLDLVDINSDINGIDTFQDFKLSAQNGATDSQLTLRDALQALTQLSFLRTLCITNRPLQTDHNTNQHRYRYQQLATAILEYLVENGSPIQMLVFTPAHAYAMPAHIRADANGHTWPFYAYQKAICTPVMSRIGQVVAVPVKLEDIRLFEPYHTALYQLENST